MQTTVTVDNQPLKNLMFHTRSENQSEAIDKAVQADLQQAKQRQGLSALRGQVDSTGNWQALRELETNHE